VKDFFKNLSEKKFFGAIMDNLEPESNRSLTERNAKGQFVKGNRAAVGHKNHRARTAQQYKETLLNCITEQDIERVVRALIKKALAGDVSAIREVLDRCLGRVSQAEQTPNDVEIVVDLPPDLIPES